MKRLLLLSLLVTGCSSSYNADTAFAVYLAECKRGTVQFTAQVESDHHRFVATCEAAR